MRTFVVSTNGFLQNRPDWPMFSPKNTSLQQVHSLLVSYVETMQMESVCWLKKQLKSLKNPGILHPYHQCLNKYWSM